jgi:hypothetical protein
MKKSCSEKKMFLKKGKQNKAEPILSQRKQKGSANNKYILRKLNPSFLQVSIKINSMTMTIQMMEITLLIKTCD